MSCWLLAMVTHARLQSELQVREPLVRSGSFVSFISCPLLLKQRGRKREGKVLVRVQKQTSSLFLLSRECAPGLIPEGTWDPVCTELRQLRLPQEEDAIHSLQEAGKGVNWSHAGRNSRKASRQGSLVTAPNESTTQHPGKGGGTERTKLTASHRPVPTAARWMETAPWAPLTHATYIYLHPCIHLHPYRPPGELTRTNLPIAATAPSPGLPFSLLPTLLMQLDMEGDRQHVP